MALNQAALGLAHADLPVFPLLPRQKRPRFRGGFHHATYDTASVVDHWSRFPTDNIGLRPPLEMAVLDIDIRNGGHHAMRKLVDEHGPLPPTWVARTGSGGWHYWFVVGEMAVRSKLREGVDIKHGGTGFVVAPP